LKAVTILFFHPSFPLLLFPTPSVTLRANKRQREVTCYLKRRIRDTIAKNQIITGSHDWVEMCMMTHRWACACVGGWYTNSQGLGVHACVAGCVVYQQAGLGGGGSRPIRHAGSIVKGEYPPQATILLMHIDGRSNLG